MEIYDENIKKEFYYALKRKHLFGAFMTIFCPIPDKIKIRRDILRFTTKNAIIKISNKKIKNTIFEKISIVGWLVRKNSFLCTDQKQSLKFDSLDTKITKVDLLTAYLEYLYSTYDKKIYPNAYICGAIASMITITIGFILMLGLLLYFLSLKMVLFIHAFFIFTIAFLFSQLISK